MSETLAVRGLHHLAIAVSDLLRAELFYGALLGLPLLERRADPEGRPRSLWLDGGAGLILMLERAPVAAPRADGPPLVAFAIAPAEREAWVARLAASGVPVERRSAFTLYVRDPDGNRVGLSHYPEAAPASSDRI